MSATTYDAQLSSEGDLPVRVRHSDETIRFFFDESSLGLGRCLALARSDVVYPGHPRCQVKAGDDDVEWLPVVAEQKWVVILRDKRVRRRPNERNELAHHNLRLLVMSAAGQLSIWEQLRIFVLRWDKIESLIQEQPGPWLYRLTKTGLTKGDYPAV